MGLNDASHSPLSELRHLYKVIAPEFLAVMDDSLVLSLFRGLGRWVESCEDPLHWMRYHGFRVLFPFSQFF